VILCASEYDTGPTYQPAPPSGEYNGLFTSDSLCENHALVAPHVSRYKRGRNKGPSYNPERIKKSGIVSIRGRTILNRTDDYRPILGVGFFVCFFRSSVILFKYRVEQG
jgi:hypothetical protein